MAKAVDLTGQTFGTWIVVRRAENSRACVARFVCTCSCGSGCERIIEATKLRHPSGVCLTCQCKKKAPGKGRPTLLQITREKLRRMYEDEGLSSSAIGERLGVSAETILTWLRAAGISVRKPAEYRKLSRSRRVEYQCQKCGKTCETFMSQPRKTCGRGCPGPGPRLEKH